MTTTTNTIDRQATAAFLSSQAGTAAEKILAAWTDHLSEGVGADSALTAKRIMDLTGLSRTTVNTNLNKLAQNGAVIRLDQDKVTTWSLTPSRKAVLKRAAKKADQKRHAAAEKAKVITPKTAATTKKVNTVTDTADTTNDERTPTGRRVKGAIDFEIRAWFEANGNAPAGSYTVANGINSSKGAAYVALRRMATQGKALLVSTEPDRYTINADSEAWN